MNRPASAALPVRLRPLDLPGDIDRAVPWYSDPDVLYFSEGPGVLPFDRTRIENMYRWLSARGQVFIIEVLDGQWIPVGDASLCENLMPIVIGDSRYQNRGVGSQVLRLLIEKAQERGLSHLIAHQIYSYNIRSIKLFEKFGFTRTETGVNKQGQEFFRYEKWLGD